MVNVPLEQLPLLFKVVLHSCKTSVVKEWPVSCALFRLPTVPWVDRTGFTGKSQRDQDGGRRAAASIARRICLFVCFLTSFFYIFISRQSWMYGLQHDAHAFVWTQQRHFLAVYRMWRCLMLQCCHCLEIVLLYFEGKGRMDWDDYFHNVDKNNYLNGNRDDDIPTFSTFSQQTYIHLSVREQIAFF